MNGELRTFWFTLTNQIKYSSLINEMMDNAQFYTQRVISQNPKTEEESTSEAIDFSAF